MWSAPQSKNRRHAPLLLWWTLGGLGGLFGILLIVGIAMILMPSGQADPSLANNTSRPTFAEASAANSSVRSSLMFPELGRPETVQGVSVYFVDLASTNRSSQPGAGTKLRVYVPPGNAAPKSVPLMLVAPAGTPLLHGNEVDAGDYHDETLPYAQAGFATIMYSLDGAMPENASEAEFAAAISRAYNQFNAARGGIVNAQIAIDFALSRLPQVDPQRIYCAGHSSAATISLVLAAKEPRIAAGIAYAPATNLELRLSDVIRDPSSSQLLTGIGVFARENSPITYVGQTRCPLFVFHAKDDSNEPFSTTSQYVEMLKQRQADVTFKTADRGDHYQSMIDQGIPAAIDWLRTKQPQLSQTQ